jgi:hypothetical protein
MNVIGARKFRKCAWILLVLVVLAVPFQAKSSLKK